MNARTEHPAMLPLKLWLSIHTHIDLYEFADWIRANLGELRGRFNRSGVPRPLMGMWLREEFLAERALNSQPVSTPTITPGPAPSKPAGSLVDFAYEEARRKLL